MDNLGKHVVALIGATAVKRQWTNGIRDNKLIWKSVTDLNEQRPESLTYPVDKMFIHPLLGTSKAHFVDPDLALARLSRPVAKFSDVVRPVCLARPGANMNGKDHLQGVQKY